jgi:hypothetical protein
MARSTRQVQPEQIRQATGLAFFRRRCGDVANEYAVSGSRWCGTYAVRITAAAMRVELLTEAAREAILSSLTTQGRLVEVAGSTTASSTRCELLARDRAEKLANQRRRRVLDTPRQHQR